MGTEALVEVKRAPVAKRLEGGLRVLVVDDDAELRGAMREVFLMRGFAVNTARDGLAAVKLARREHYDVVVCDLRLPGMDGIGVTQKLKGLPDAPRIILITAYPEWNLYDEARVAGADQVLGKPVSLGRLVALVEEVAASQGTVETPFGD